MTLDEAQHWLKHMSQPLVRLRRRDGTPGWHGARMYQIKGLNAFVKPFTHKKEELVSLDDINIWTAKLPQGVPIYAEKPTKPLSAPLFEIIKKGDPVYQQQLPIQPPKKKRTRQNISTEKLKEIRSLLDMGKTMKEASIISGISYGWINSKFNVYVKELRDQELSKRPSKTQSAYTAGVSTATVTLAPGLTIEKPAKKPAEGLESVIRMILALKIPDTSKLLTIEGLLSNG